MTPDGVSKRGLIETATGEEVIPIVERDDIQWIRPLPDGFVAFQQTNGRWRIESIEAVRLAV
jgi:hypothetical protein